MLSYPIDEAEELLVARLKEAKGNLSNCEEDLDFLREQITVRILKSSLNSIWKLTCISDYGGCYGESL